KIFDSSHFNKTIYFEGETEEMNNQIGVCRFDVYKLQDGQYQFLFGGTGSGQYSNEELEEGNFKLVVTTGEDPQIACMAEFKWIKETFIDNPAERKTGSIRIQRIESFDNNEQKIIREYFYKDIITN